MGRTDMTCLGWKSLHSLNRVRKHYIMFTLHLTSYSKEEVYLKMLDATAVNIIYQDSLIFLMILMIFYCKSCDLSLSQCEQGLSVFNMEKQAVTK